MTVEHRLAHWPSYAGSPVAVAHDDRCGPLGTRRAWRQGCRCNSCRADMRRQSRLYWALYTAERGSTPQWKVSTDRARRRIALLRAAGWSIPASRRGGRHRAVHGLAGDHPAPLLQHRLGRRAGAAGVPSGTPDEAAVIGHTERLEVGAANDALLAIP